MSARTIKTMQLVLTGDALIRHNLRKWQREQKLRLHTTPQPRKFWHGGLVVVAEAINQAVRS
jgi:hypothetical protein